ncbi:MAG: hypothetical protein ACRDDY_13690 [Clostridium sp.]|uniref:DUF7941 domain-family protein n=1 Tax=Clostridium sp. TaxID=1506 RepID=UPI003EE4B263
MNYPEDNLYKLVQLHNPDAIINHKTVYVVRDEVVRLPETEPFKYKAVLYSKAASIYYGTETIRYDKYDMTSYSNLYPLDIPNDVVLHGWDLIDAIEKRYGFRLRKEDVVNSRVTLQSGLKLANRCILYEGIIKVQYEEDIDLNDVIVNTVLDGFHLEIVNE